MAEIKKSQNPKADISLNLDTTPILYSDRIGITVNRNGVVLDIMQSIGPTNKARVVSRVGMSQEHARKFVKELSKLLAISQPSAVKSN
jgi:hypothetical protein